MNPSFIESYLRQSSEVIASLAQQAPKIVAIVDALFAVSKAGGRLYTCGNGGSACDAMHFAEELVARYLRERPGIRAQHLLDAGTLTCWANDYDYASVFERQVKTLVTPADALIAFSTSGKSENVLAAIKAANEIAALTIAFTGKDGGEAKNLARHFILVRSSVTSHIQEAHAALVHIVCDLLEQRLYPECG